MLHEHPDHPGRRVRLAYCLNLHPAEDLEQTLAGMRAITLPLRDRLARKDARARALFGAGLYLPAAVARRLASAAGEDDLERLAVFVAESGLDPFTYNGFPAGGFHASGLKEGVFRPTWMEEARVTFTLDVARVAARLARAAGGPARSHVSISTHSGAFGAAVKGEADEVAIAENLGRAVAGLARLEDETGVRIVLSIEAEPRASCGSNAALAGFLERVHRNLGARIGERFLARHLGTCLDTCHSAVEFEDAAEALALATRRGPLGKLQFSSALALPAPARNARGREQLLAMAEPRYLHQVTGRGVSGRAETVDLPELRAQLAAGATRDRWLACDEWRCHFHVPVDLESVGDCGLSTTRDHADRILGFALADPTTWGVEELHLEIETYTWDVLPGAARGAGALVDGLEREYAHVTGLLARAGWRRSAESLR
jgi:hypothetical protein